jgi:hypothetical protein
MTHAFPYMYLMAAKLSDPHRSLSLMAVKRDDPHLSLYLMVAKLSDPHSTPIHYT